MSGNYRFTTVSSDGIRVWVNGQLVINNWTDHNTATNTSGATDAEVLKTLMRFDPEVAGFDSRDGTTPKALAVLCTTGKLLRDSHTSDALAAALNEVTATMAAQ